MISLTFTEAEVVEIANHTAFTAFHALEDNDEEAWRVATVAVAILDKIDAAFPEIVESEALACLREAVVLRRRVAERQRSIEPK